MAFSSLLGLPIEQALEKDPVGLRLSGENSMVTEVNKAGKIKGLELFTIVKGIDGGKVLPDDDIAAKLGELSPGPHSLKVISAKGQKKKAVPIDVLP